MHGVIALPDVLSFDKIISPFQLKKERVLSRAM